LDLLKYDVQQFSKLVAGAKTKGSKFSVGPIKRLMYSGKQIESTVYKVLEKNQHSLQLEYGISGL